MSSDGTPIGFEYKPPEQKSLHERAAEAKKWLYETPFEEKISKIQEQGRLAQAQSIMDIQTSHIHGIETVVPRTLPPQLQRPVWAEDGNKTPRVVLERTREGLLHFAQWRNQVLEEATTNFVDRYMQKTIENLLDGSAISPLVLNTADMPPKLARDFIALLPDEKALVLQQLREIPVRYHQKTTGKLSDAQAEQLLNDSNFGIIVKENGRKKITDAQPLAWTLAEQIVSYLYDPLRKEQKLWGKAPADGTSLLIEKGEKYAQEAWRTYNEKKTFTVTFADLSAELQERVNALDVERDYSTFLYNILENICKSWLQLTELQVAEAVQRGWAINFGVS